MYLAFINKYIYLLLLKVNKTNNTKGIEANKFVSRILSLKFDLVEQKQLLIYLACFFFFFFETSDYYNNKKKVFFSYFFILSPCQIVIELYCVPI